MWKGVQKIKKCEYLECKNKFSYKFRTGNIDELIVKQINQNNFYLLVLTTLDRSTHGHTITFSDAQTDNQ